jgi:hypothetical protein
MPAKIYSDVDLELGFENEKIFNKIETPNINKTEKKWKSTVNSKIIMAKKDSSLDRQNSILPDNKKKFPHLYKKSTSKKKKPIKKNRNMDKSLKIRNTGIAMNTNSVKKRNVVKDKKINKNPVKNNPVNNDPVKNDTNKINTSAPEFRTNLAKLYRELLNRGVDESGLKTYTKAIDENFLTWDGVKKSIMNSSEYKELHKSE